jgi:alpha-glucosidase (family GH31 glycosyl hydrolase)
VRGFDTFTYGSLPTCAPGTGGATCADTFEPLHTDGLLDQAGWRLLDDTQSAVWNSQGWIEPRPQRGDVEDGYLFVYGHDFSGALRSLARLTGAAPLLPRNVFGVWYSDYTPYSARFIEDTLYPAFEREGVPLDTLSLDTDWKAPSDWDGWEWASSLFPDPSAFLRWAHGHGIDVTLNIHSSIALDDPDITTAQSVAGGTLAKSACTAGICRIWDWSSIPQAESNFDLQQSLQSEGVSFFWLDWCCDNSVVSMRGVTPDAWIGHLYAQQMVNEGERGFVLARIGSSNGNPQRVYAAGPWSDHTSAIAFTGDAWGTWATLAQEVALTPDEATIGEPYVSDDIGSYLGPPPQGTQDPADLYDRWVQFGTFEPLMRLHSNDEKRLPWQFPQPVRSVADSFLRLRQALVPYTYTLAAQAHQDGLPMTRPLYLDYPGQSAAYTHAGEYLYGPDVLVAPVTAPGTVAPTTLWVPPGRWTDYFTGATVTGPSTVTVDEPLDRMPVFVRAGGIIPEEPSSTGSSSHGGDTMVLHVYAGAEGAFSLYGDSGTGLGYEKGQFTTTPITDTTGSGTAGGATSVGVTVGAARGHYPGAPASVRYEIDMEDLSAPAGVTLDGRELLRRSPGSGAEGWYYRAATDTVVVDTGARSTNRSLTVVTSGSGVLDRSEPDTPASPAS